MLKYFDKKSYIYIDLGDAFETLGKDFEIEKLVGGHYTALGNQLVAKHLLQYFDDNELLNRELIKYKIIDYATKIKIDGAETSL